MALAAQQASRLFFVLAKVAKVAKRILLTIMDFLAVFAIFAIFAMLFFPFFTPNRIRGLLKSLVVLVYS